MGYQTRMLLAALVAGLVAGACLNNTYTDKSQVTRAEMARLQERVQHLEDMRRIEPTLGR